MTRNEKYKLGVSKFIKKGLTLVQSGILYKQTDPEWEEKDEIYCYLNKDDKEIYIIKRLGSCCGPWLSVSCRILRRKGYAEFNFDDTIEADYMGGKRTAYRVVFTSEPEVVYNENFPFYKSNLIQIYENLTK